MPRTQTGSLLAEPEVGPLTRLSVVRVQQQFTAPEDQFFAQNFPSIASFPRQQELNRVAGAALLDRIGPAIRGGRENWLFGKSCGLGANA